MFLSWILNAVARRLNERRTIRLLQECDDHMLADLGLSRGQIPGVVRGGFTR